MPLGIHYYLMADFDEFIFLNDYSLLHVLLQLSSTFFVIFNIFILNLIDTNIKLIILGLLVVTGDN